jgi:hypothetical protein
MKNQKLIYLVLLIILLAAPLHAKRAPLPSVAPTAEPACLSPDKIDNTHVITVFIHGTTLVPKFLRKMHSFDNQLGALGLHPLETIDDPAQLCASDSPRVMIASLYHKVFTEVHAPASNTSFSYYTFGWHAPLLRKARQRAAHELHEALIAERDRMQALHPDKRVKICLISHSHGGNVALHLVDCNKHMDKTVHIDDFILLGCPIQRETRNNVDSRTFGNIFHAYSRGDMAQTADMFSSLTSRQKFSQVRRTPLPKNVYEIEVDAAGVQPSHHKLWALGRLPWPLPRKKFPIHPLPITVFAPAILAICTQHPQMENTRHISVIPYGDTYRISMNDEASCDVTLNFDCTRKLE